MSYIKPHWPYIVPAPYHDMYGDEHVPPAMRSEVERENPHPVYGAYMEGRVARAFGKEEVRRKVIPAYMGLIRQCDDQLGRLLDHLDATGKLADTMIVLTSDHGDYLGDHWLGEKDLFHEPSVKIPLIIHDPRKEADATRARSVTRWSRASTLPQPSSRRLAGRFPIMSSRGVPSAMAVRRTAFMARFRHQRI
ncbi:MAG: sulfatase-like hydrolase/transferase [Geminicoccaceae bacterium]